jgi:hypothetical protein
MNCRPSTRMGPALPSVHYLASHPKGPMMHKPGNYLHTTMFNTPV